MRIKGFGGVFWRSNDLDRLTNWYKNTLDITMEGWNGTIIKSDADNETVFSISSSDDDYFPKAIPSIKTECLDGTTFLSYEFHTIIF